MRECAGRGYAVRTAFPRIPIRYVSNNLLLMIGCCRRSTRVDLSENAV
jgi:hypothetical protein